MALIIPKNNADAQTLDATLKIYYDANDWVQNAMLINKLSAALDYLGIEDEKKEPQSYTKKTQVLAYYGFITWQDVSNSQSARRITDLGREFYEARLSRDTDRVIEVLIKSLSTCTFGRNVIGCDSDSDIEAPNVFIKASLLLNGLNNNEFAFILGKMELSGADFSDAIFQIKVNRLKGLKTYPTDNARKWNDPKPITALKNWGFFNSDDNTISNSVLLKYSDALINLRIKNTETVRFVSEQEDEKDDSKDVPLQQIYYGAPGTGKSHEIKEKTKGEAVIRTTFHPDSDYSTFVGAYKPTMDDVDAKVVPVVLGESGTVFNKNEGTYKEKRIVYQFVMQAFLKAYLSAWKKYAEANGDEVNPQFLIIEEINRGNCAQIFGDLFQLLDRGDKGFSEYPIEADNDLQREIERAFKEHKDYKLKDDVKINVEGVVEDYTSNYGATLSEDIQSGRVLLLPQNLYIWATMNTSDQSLFPIDSAFKRRWEWKYIPIAQGRDEHGNPMIWQIEGQGENSWWTFIQGINEVIDVTTHSEDKKLGFFFCKAQDGVIKKETFVNKVVFYLWNDVFKVYGFKSEIFDKKGKDDKTEKITFKSFYKKDGSVDEETMSVFVKNVMAKAPKEDSNNDVSNESKEISEESETEA